MGAEKIDSKFTSNYFFKNHRSSSDFSNKFQRGAIRYGKSDDERLKEGFSTMKKSKRILKPLKVS